ncbi:hypothetical protein AMS68_007267 [Peltaster fructicola]|uniref:3-hydroxyacyl-CoA dehydrogenase C-terminal domain-containing protein n=1 Tax=Peltaster fructicola TaxID=286661 RepID=A0A6H0Y563_9PEZI|nr:hypothetical protein AMS68_007267 [Peltaster fructicola]
MAYHDPVPVLYVLDFNVGKNNDDPEDPFKSGRVAVGSAAGGQLKTLIDHERMPDGIDVLQDDSQDGRIFWTQMGHAEKNDGQVQSAALDGSDVKDIYKPGEIHTPKQITVDRVNRKLYICDREGLRVHRSNLDGSEKEVLVKRGDWNNSEHVKNKDIHCVGVTADAKHGKFYWTQKGPSKGGSGQIYRANIEMPAGETAETRSDIEQLFKELPEPIDLEIDSETQTLYWSDRGDVPRGNTLNKADVSGSAKSGHYDIIARHLHEAIGIRIDNKHKHIYATDLGGSVYQYRMDGSHVREMFKDQGAYTGIAVAELSASRAKELYGIIYE